MMARRWSAVPEMPLRFNCDDDGRGDVGCALVLTTDGVGETRGQGEERVFAFLRGGRDDEDRLGNLQLSRRGIGRGRQACRLAAGGVWAARAAKVRPSRAAASGSGPRGAMRA